MHIPPFSDNNLKEDIFGGCGVTRFKKALYVALSILVSAAIFTGTAFLFLYDKSSPADNTLEGIPYYEETPSAVGLLFCFEEGGSVFLNLDFDENETRVLLLPNGANDTDVTAYGYTVFKTVKTDYECLSSVIDRLGGIELSDDTLGRLRYTGVQVTETLSHTAAEDIRREIISAVLEKIKAGAFTKEILVYIIENSDTSLSFPDAYGWLPHLQDIATDLQFIN